MDDDLELSIAVIACVIAAGVLWFFDDKVGPGMDLQETPTREITATLPQYERAKIDGPPMLACVHADTIAVNFARLGDTPRAQEWHWRKEADCERVTRDGRE